MVPEQAASKGKKVSLIASVIVIIMLALSLGVVYFQDSASIAALNGTVSSQSTKIAGLQSSVSSQSEVISVQSSVISSQSSVVSSQSSVIASQALNITHLVSLNSNLKAQVTSLDTEVSNLNNQILTDQSTIATLTAELTSPTLSMWNVVTTAPPGYFLYEVVPDTFVYHDTWASNQPATVYYFTVVQFSDWYQYGLSAVSGSYYTVGPITSSNDNFYLAEGCGWYVAVYLPSNSNVTTTFYPNISVTYSPAPQATGACA